MGFVTGGLQTQPMPPRAGWVLWQLFPPAYKPGRVVEVWHAEMGDQTDHWNLDDVTVRLDPRGLWWRPA